MKILKISLKEHHLIKYYVAMHLVLLNPKYDRYQRGLVSTVYRFEKMSTATRSNTSTGANKSEVISNH